MTTQTTEVTEATEAIQATPRTGGQLIVEQLVAQDIKHVFCVPGETFFSRF